MTPIPHPQVSTRLDAALYERVRDLAEAMYDGNEAMLARVAIKRFVAANYHVLETADEREAVAV